MSYRVPDGDRRREPWPVEVGAHFRHVSPRGNITIWEVAELGLVDNGCRITLLYSLEDWSDPNDATHMHLGDTTIYSTEILRYYKLWELIPEEDVPLILLGALP